MYVLAYVWAGSVTHVLISKLWAPSHSLFSVYMLCSAQRRPTTRRHKQRELCAFCNNPFNEINCKQNQKHRIVCPGLGCRALSLKIEHQPTATQRRIVMYHVPKPNASIKHFYFVHSAFGGNVLRILWLLFAISVLFCYLNSLCACVCARSTIVSTENVEFLKTWNCERARSLWSCNSKFTATTKPRFAIGIAHVWSESARKSCFHTVSCFSRRRRRQQQRLLQVLAVRLYRQLCVG